MKPQTLPRPDIPARSTQHPVPVLVIDDDPMSADLVREILASDRISVFVATDSESGIEQVRRLRPPVVILDLVMPGTSGLAVLQEILDIDSGIDVILLTGDYSTESAVKSIQLGACDYLTKPVSPVRLIERVARCIEEMEARISSQEREASLLGSSQLEGIVGRSPVMLELFSKMRRIAPHFQTVLITGDTGCGKELVARGLHRLSPVGSRNWVVCNCAALVDTLVESELFGHVKGAFTGATQDKTGLVEHASGGTLFLDEIGELPLSTQAKLLRLIQNREVQRLGAPAARRVDVRIIAATHQNLSRMVAEKRFREDLYYRLTTIHLRVPALLERREDLPLLETHFLNVYSERYGRPGMRLSRRAQALLSAHVWPGNVREMENVLSHGCIMAETDTIEVRHLPDSIRSASPKDEAALPVTLKEVQQAHVQKMLDHTNGNIVHAARLLGISRATLYRMLAPKRSQLSGSTPHRSAGVSLGTASAHR